MKDIFKAPFIVEMSETTANMYRQGWDERNGGNISYMLEEEEVAEYLDLGKVIRTIPTGFDASKLAGKIFLVTGTGKYFKNVQKDPETNLGIVRISADGTQAELLWGYKDGGKFTSEFPAHMMSHIARLEQDPNHRVVAHSHHCNEHGMLHRRESIHPQALAVQHRVRCGIPRRSRRSALHGMRNRGDRYCNG